MLRISVLRCLFNARDGDTTLYRSFLAAQLLMPLFVLPITLLVMAIDPAPAGPAIACLLLTVSFWSLAWMARKKLKLAANLSVQLITLLSLVGSFFYGGPNSPFAAWLIVALLTGTLYLPRNLISWGGIMVVQIGTFTVAFSSWPDMLRIDPSAIGALFVTSSGLAAVFVTLITAYFSRIRADGAKLSEILTQIADLANRREKRIWQLQDNDREVRDYMAGASHELRTALDVVIGYSELLLEDADEEEREADERRLSRIIISSRNLLALIIDANVAIGAQLEAQNESDTDEAPAVSYNSAGFSRDLTFLVPFRRIGLGIAFVCGLAVVLVTLAENLSLLPTMVSVGAMACALVAGRQLLLEADVSAGGGTDKLTGLMDRRAFWQKLENRFAVSPKVQAAVLFADLDGFKDVNDALGHDTGDALLSSVAERFARICPPEVILARLGGDEFGAAAWGPQAENLIRFFASQMRDVLAQPVEVDGQILEIGVSIGIAVNSTGDIKPREMFRRSDVAMYRAKSDNRDAVQAFEPEMDEALNFRRTIRNDFESALAGEGLDLHLQPVVDARSGSLSSAEALLRWNHPVLGPISPEKLVSIAGESGQMVALDDWVLERALDYIGNSVDVPIAINVSPLQFRQPYFARKIVDRLDAHGVPADKLRLEITEGVLVTHTRASGRTICELREAGIKLALDDFGTGYSSLSYLKDFGFDLLKVDRSFVSALDKGRQGAELLRAIIDLGHSLSMKVIIEGVETAEQSAYVQLLGSDFIQGYFTGHPMPLRQFMEWQGAQEGQSDSERRGKSPNALTPAYKLAG